ncbi:MAG TPA: hypothetical protein VGM88_06055 [Kofleriaceae bacterium]|jgi:hypothetical protein
MRAVFVLLARSGKDKLVYEGEACGTADGVVVHAPTRSTGFATADEWLRGEIAKATIPPADCEHVVAVLSRFDCH